MHIAHQADGRIDISHILLLNQDIFELMAQDADCLLLQELTVEWSADEFIDVEGGRHRQFVIVILWLL